MSFTNLTHHEILARDHFKSLLIEGSQVPIESYDGSTTNNVGPPAWFDEQQYDLGREYFMENRFGIVNANLLGLIVVLSLPRGLALIRNTNRSNTAETARNRYADTIIHIMTWYDLRLKKESKAWDSLQRVRKYHWFASNAGQDKNLGFMSQRDVSITTFGFAGFVINRPHLFGIRSQNQKKRRAFLHFWAVINYMIGVEDRFNICLLPIEAVEIEFDLLMRNVFIPYLQIETLAFKQMINDMLVGLQHYVPFLEYQSQMFMMNRAIGLPGYQLDVDSKREIPHRNILSPEDVAEIRKVEPKFSDKILFYSVLRKGRSNSDCRFKSSIDPFSPKAITNYYNEDSATQKKLMGLACYSQIKKVELDRGPSYLNHLSSKQFHSLNPQAQYLVNLNIAGLSLLKQSRGVALLNQFLDTRINEIRNITSNFQLRFDHVYPESYRRGPGIK